MSALVTTMQVKVLWSLNLLAESSRLELAAMLTRCLYSSVALTETFCLFLTRRSPESPSPLSWITKNSAFVTCLSHMAFVSGSMENHSTAYEVSCGGTDAWSTAQNMHSDGAWLRHNKWVSVGLRHFESIDLHCDLHISI